MVNVIVPDTVLKASVQCNRCVYDMFLSTIAQSDCQKLTTAQWKHLYRCSQSAATYVWPTTISHTSDTVKRAACSVSFFSEILSDQSQLASQITTKLSPHIPIKEKDCHTYCTQMPLPKALGIAIKWTSPSTT